MKRTQLIFLFLFVMGISVSGQNTIERMDPPNWWTGMQHNEIQVLVYGANVAQLNPVIEYDGVELLGTETTDNPNYLFLNLRIKKEVKAGLVEISFGKKNRRGFSHNFPILERTHSQKSIKGFDASDAIYLITPDRFANGDPSNDSMETLKEKANRSNKGGRHGGDIEGIRKNLDYIKDLGFTAVWLNPLLENDMETYSYHGYSTTDFYKVDPRFGSNEAYQNLAKEAKEKDIKLIMDMIVNHCGSNHWWMEDLPSEDWINQWEEMTFTNHRKTLLQDPYASDLDKKVFTDGWFVETMPDLNQRNPHMAKYLIQNSIWWVEYLGLAGIRMDTYPYPDMDFMTEWTEAMALEYPDLNIVGEEWFEWPTIVSYWQKDKQNSNGYTSELQSLMDFPLNMALIKGLTVEETWSDGWIDVYEMLAHDYLYASPNDLVIFPDNHDMARIYAQVGEDYEKFQQAIAFFLTMRGVPQLYYGTEILMAGPAERDDGLIRSDLPGGWEGDKVNAFTGEGLSDKQKEAQEYIRQLLQWRKTATAVYEGKLKHFLPKDGIYVYFRYNDDQKIMVILSKNETATKLDLTRFSEVLEGTTKAKNVLTDKEYALEKELMIDGQSVYVLEIE